MKNLKFIHIVGTASALVFTGGCTAAFLDTAAHGIFVQEETNFSEKNYAAADYLIQQGKSFISRHALITAQPLSDVNQPNMESQFGKMVPEQIGIRLSQLGYRMDLQHVATAEDTNYLRPAISSNEKTDFVLSGTFHRRRIEMDVSVRMIDTRNNRVVAVFDYTLPLNREIADLARPQPKIMRLPQ